MGLSNMLAVLDEDSTRTIQQTSIQGLDVLPSGPIPKNPAELLSSNYFKLLLDEVKRQYDLIIIDAPPLLAVADAQILSNKCDATILIASVGKVEKSDITKTKVALQASQANLLGVILNNVKLGKSSYYYQ